MTLEALGSSSPLGWPGPDLSEAIERLADTEPPPLNGWWAPQAPNGRVLGFDLSRMDEDALLREGGRAALIPLGDGPQDYDPRKEPLILVHGINGDPKNLQAVADRFRNDDRYQIYVLAYDDAGRRTSRNGEDFAEQLKMLLDRMPPGADRRMKIVAHSMGGIVTRRALNVLAQDPDRPLDDLEGLDVVAVDTPWHGYPGPSDRGLGRLAMAMARPFLDDGLEDMRARSNMFRGDPRADRPDRRKGLFDVELPSNVRIDSVFAREGDEAWDYTETKLRRLVPEILDWIREDDPVRGPARVRNMFGALRDSAAWPTFEAHVRSLAERGELDERMLRRALENHFPRFPGGHTSVLEHRPPGERGLIDWLADRWGSDD